jgi:hypothetical protein
MPQSEIKDPQLAPNEAAIVISEVNGEVTAGVFYGSEIKQNSTSYQIVEQLLAAVLGVSKGATLLEDTTCAMPADSEEKKEG